MNFIGQKVSHKKYGAGRVKSFERDAVTVYFEAWGAHTFPFPQAFAKELRAVDPAFDQAVREQIARGE
jgi:hypothetical protein